MSFKYSEDINLLISCTIQLKFKNLSETQGIIDRMTEQYLLIIFLYISFQ